MKALFTLLFVFAIVLIAAGFYRGWFTFSSSDVDKRSNKVELNLTVDKDKMKEDANVVKEKAREMTDGVEDDAKDDAMDDAKESATDGEDR